MSEPRLCGAPAARGPCRNRTRRGVARCYVHAAPLPVRELDGDVEAVALESIQAAAVDDWRAAAWLLERQWPAKYARPATRTGEIRPPPDPEPTVDGLDELAGRRSARRSSG